MAHHKRGKPKSSRRGCLWCKPNKHQRSKDKKGSVKPRYRKADDSMKQQLSE